MGKKAISKLIPIFGFLFLTAYIRSATCDVVYTDYIRIINSYLPNVWNIGPYMSGDVLTRIPITYLERIINVVLFGYSTTFDMILGAIGLGFAGVLIASYMTKHEFRLPAIIATLFIVFSLDKWEMLTNGSGWVHFWAIALFIYSFIVYDRFASGEGKKGDETRLLILPPVIMLLFAGPYSAVYFSAMCAVYVIDFIIRKNADGRRDVKGFAFRLIAIAVPFILYYISRALSSDGISDAKASESLLGVIFTQPGYIFSLIIKSFAAVAIGGETVTELQLPQAVVILIGIIVIAAYVLAIVEFFKSGLYKKTYLPLLLIVSGLASHALIVLARWTFMNDMYAMSSRYSIQYMLGAVGIMLTFAQTKPKAWKYVIIAILLIGQILTTRREILVAPYRKAGFENITATALDYENQNVDDLKAILQYHDPQKTREALTILKENRLNIWRTNTD